MTNQKPVVLLILDGWGVRSETTGNAIAKANTPHWDALIQQYPHMLLSACGEDVGLPAGQMGNSEVGHLTLGAGRVIYQDLTRISKAIHDGTFFQNTILLNAFARAKTTQKAVHILGLLSPGGVHSHQEHLFACLKMAAANQCHPIFVHAFLDGRDTPPKSAASSLEKLEKIIQQTPGAHLASISGRYYAMDRDNRWDRIQLCYDALVHWQAPFFAHSGLEALHLAYARQETDEFVKPTCISKHGQKGMIQNGDIVIMMNFRADRARELTYALTHPTFNEFPRGDYPVLGEFVSLTEYDKTLKVSVAFPPENHVNVLGEYLQHHHLTQCHLAETEKYAHVTFFFNGGRETPFEGEERILVPSPKVATYDLTPEMSAIALTEKLTSILRAQRFDFVICNYANADMIGHTGNFNATVKAIETLDDCIGQIVAALNTVEGQMLITSDHGNAECMEDLENGQPHTAHTTSLVPLIYVGNKPLKFITSEGKLSDIAPTLLMLMGLKHPPEMTGHTLLTQI
ncbi:MAG: 2,3-bisphosphoglycerate-independent phosphoglycerate mutase [Candidatus Berkiellales bacterium]